MQKVRSRLVLYIPSYDPVPPRRYRELNRRQSAKQAAISGFEIALRPKSKGGRFGWHVDAKIENQTVRTDFVILPWSDLVRSSMAQGIAATYGQLLSTVWIYIASGTLWRLARMRKGPTLAVLYPITMLVAATRTRHFVRCGVGCRALCVCFTVGCRAWAAGCSYCSAVVSQV